ncbi:hypothetical protein AB0H20_01820 [Nocardia fluminea]|uniref:hypothetical protein n=1 Tax=Nocardia fluminea TaxID=134984 RepID=UPI0034061E49
MIVMSRLTMANYWFESLVAEYEAAHSFTGTVGFKIEVPAHVRLRLNGMDGSERLILDIEHVRQLAEELPKLLMAHDAAEHEKAVVKAAAEIDSARKAA